MTLLELEFSRQFVDRLPADPVVENYTRGVEQACYSRVAPTRVSAPELLALVPEVAALIDLDPTPSPELAEVLAGNRVVPGMEPYAACYGGHQFGSWAGQLGDGRAITLGEVKNRRGEIWELQLKGAGPTPYSRRADGRAVLRSSLRELVCSEAMFHLGVPTTRALSLVLTGDRVVRDMLYDGRPAPEPGAIVCRVAPSFLRFGSFEIHASRNDRETLARLVGYTIDTLYPSLRRTPDDDTLDVAGLLAEVARRTARMVVDWMRVGFVHGVMNTDNMSILGLTIDYGPYGWIDNFDPNWTPNTTDASGRRYRFGYQPRIAQWNLLQLARSLAVLVDDTKEIEAALEEYAKTFAPAQQAMMLQKLGLDVATSEGEADDELVGSLMALFNATEIDMTLFYRGLASISSTPGASWRDAILPSIYASELRPDEETRLVAWIERYRQRIARAAVPDDVRATRMNAVNPLYVPRNYLLQEVIDKVTAGDRQALPELLDVLRRPYTVQPGREAFAQKRPDWARHKVGCSMLSCSS